MEEFPVKFCVKISSQMLGWLCKIVTVEKKSALQVIREALLMYFKEHADRYNDNNLKRYVKIEESRIEADVATNTLRKIKDFERFVVDLRQEGAPDEVIRKVAESFKEEIRALKINEVTKKFYIKKLEEIVKGGYKIEENVEEEP